jgi:hypothetical protein
MHIPPESCPTEAGDKARAEGVTVKVKMIADYINDATQKEARHLFSVDVESEVPDYELPFIVKETPKFDVVKKDILLLSFTITGGGSMVTEHLFNGLIFFLPYQRGVSALREIFKKSGKYILTVYVMDGDRAPALGPFWQPQSGII